MPALTAADVRSARFVATRFREGYEVAEVDALLERVAASLDALAAGRVGDDVLTGDDVLHARFRSTKFRDGYDQDEVDDFLDDAVEALRAAHAAVRAAHAPSAPSSAPSSVASSVAVGMLEAMAAVGGGWVRAAAAELAPARRTAGYAVAATDELLERAAEELDRRARGASGHLTAHDVRGARLATTWWGEGYPRSAVDPLLERVAAALAG